MFVFMLLPDGKIENDYWAGRAECPCCGKLSHFHLQNTKNTLHVCMIPTMTKIDDRYITCDSCGYKKKLRIVGYNLIRGRQKKMLKRKSYPREMIESDFEPKKVAIAWRTVKLILTGLLMTSVFLGMLIESFNDFGLFGSFGLALLISLPCLPFFLLSLNGIIPCWRKRAFYKMRMQYPCMEEVIRNGEIHDISDIVDSRERKKYEQILREMDEGFAETSGEKTEMLADEKNQLGEFAAVEDEPPIPLKKLPEKYPNGKGWFRYGARFFVVPKAFLKEKELHAPCYRLAAGRFRMLLIWNNILLLAGLLMIGNGIWWVGTNSENAGGLVVLGFFIIAVSVGLLIINRILTSRIIKSLRMLVKTDKFQYIDEVMPFIGNTNEKFIFGQHLMYDKGARLIIAYDNILWAYSTTDENNNVRTALCMSDGLRYTSEMDEILLGVFLKRKTDILVGKTSENEVLYKQKLAQLNGNKQ